MCSGVCLVTGIRPFSFQRLKYVALSATALRRFEAVGQAAASTYVLLDQWVLQFVWSACAFGAQPNPINLQRFVQAACTRPNRLVVFVDVDDEVAVRRIRQRESQGSRFDRLSDQSAAQQWMRESRRCFAPILETMRASGSTVIEISGSARVEESVARILRAIRSMRSCAGYHNPSDECPERLERECDRAN